MKSTSFYVFIALGALLISHSSAAPISGFKTVGDNLKKLEKKVEKKLEKIFLGNKPITEAEVKTSAGSVENQVDALLQMTFDGIQSFFDGMNEALAEEQQNRDGGHGVRRRGHSESYDASEALASITALTLNMAKLFPQIGSKFFGIKFW